MNNRIYHIKKRCVLYITMLALPLMLHAQFGIGTSSPNANAILDVYSLSKGIRLMSIDNLPDATSSEGLLVYSGNTLKFSDGSNWYPITISNTYSGESPANTASGIGIGTNIIGTDAILEIATTDKMGILLPKIPDASKAAIAVEGMLIYNNDNNIVEYYNGATWISLGKGASAGAGSGSANGKGIKLGASGSANANALLELASTTKGLLLPRVTTIPPVAGNAGMFLYDDDNNRFLFSNGINWVGP